MRDGAKLGLRGADVGGRVGKLLFFFVETFLGYGVEVVEKNVVGMRAKRKNRKKLTLPTSSDASASDDDTDASG